MLKIESVSYLACRQPLEYYEAWYRADRSRFEIEVVVEPAPTRSVLGARLRMASID